MDHDARKLQAKRASDVTSMSVLGSGRVGQRGAVEKSKTHQYTITVHHLRQVLNVGGIAPRILPYLQKHFMTGFTDKGRFRELLNGLPVHVITDPLNGLKGAAANKAKSGSRQLKNAGKIGIRFDDVRERPWAHWSRQPTMNDAGSIRKTSSFPT